MGKLMETPVVCDGEFVARPMMYLCLSYDHRLIEGATAVRFLQTVKGNLEDIAVCLLTRNVN
jgi:2-oxoglutarate dehydrogenase E2 component (dihydrolipoamide succinyltransferase)